MYKFFYCFFILVVACAFVFGTANFTLAQKANDFGLDETAQNTGIPTDMTISGTIGTVIGVVLSFVGVVFLILMIYAGFIWMMARGNEQEVGKAKNIIIAAVVGILIVAAAYAITKVVFDALGV